MRLNYATEHISRYFSVNRNRVTISPHQRALTICINWLPFALLHFEAHSPRLLPMLIQGWLKNGVYDIILSVSWVLSQTSHSFRQLDFMPAISRSTLNGSRVKRWKNRRQTYLSMNFLSWWDTCSQLITAYQPFSALCKHGICLICHELRPFLVFPNDLNKRLACPDFPELI